MAAKKTLEISEEVSDVLHDAQFYGDLLTLPEQLDRKLYTQVMKICEAYSGKWNRSRGGIMFPSAAHAARLKAALSSGVAVREKVVAQAYYTPDAAAEALIRHLLPLDLPADGSLLRVLEPSAGNGALVRKLASKAPGVCDVTMVELDREAYDVLRADPSMRYNLGGWCFINEDFLGITPGGDMKNYDLVLMNPPWANGQAGKHLIHALKFLRKGGVLGAILPPIVELPETLVGTGLAMYDLPEGSFKESGTNVRAKIAVVWK